MKLRHALLAALALGPAVSIQAAPDSEAGAGAWRLADGVVAPWADHAVAPDPALRGREVRFEPGRVVAPHPIGCDGARYEWRFPPPEGLFEGNLPAPAVEAAGRLGIAPGPVPTLRTTCTNAGFDFHRDDRGNLLLGLDNVVWRLAPAGRGDSPADVVLALLSSHFTHDMAFTADSVRLKQAFLSMALRARIDAYLAVPGSPDEAPLINGDPFTDSQEYPDRFTLGTAETRGDARIVPVRFADDVARHRVDYLLVQEGGRWVVDDLVDGRQQSFRDLLATGAGDFTGVFARLRPVFASGSPAEIAAQVRVPFLYEGRELDRAGVEAIVPALFGPAVRRCLASVAPVAEDNRQVVSCPPYAFYFGRDAEGYRLLEFGADGEDVP